MAKKRTSQTSDENIREVEAELVFEDEQEEQSSQEPQMDDESDDEVVADDSFIQNSLATVDPNSHALAKTDPLTKYIQEVQRYPLLSKEEEYDLAVRYRETGDPEAAEKLVTANLRFVISVAAEFSKYGPKMIDLIQEGNVGLMHAVREFDPGKGVRLISYAVWWIKGYIKEFLLRQQSLVRLGTNAKQKKLFHHLRREQAKQNALGGEVDVKLLASRLEVSEQDVIRMQQRISQGDLSLDQQLDPESRTQLLDMQYDRDEELQDEKIARLELIELVKSKVNLIKDSLNEKELAILERRVLADEPQTLQEIGDHFGISRERSRQIEARLIDKIRKLVMEDVSGEF